MAKRKLTIEEVQKRVTQAHSYTVILDVSTYRGTTFKARFIDKEYGEFWVTPSNVYNKQSRHPQHKNVMLSKLKKLSIEEIKARLFNIHGNILTIDISTYKGMLKKAKFIDIEHGEWWAKPNDIISLKAGHKNRSAQKQKDTMIKIYGVDNASKSDFIKNKKIETSLRIFGVSYPIQNFRVKNRAKKTLQEKYGVDNPMQNRDIALKCAKSTNKYSTKYHWNTNEELICIGSYETKTVDYLNENRIDFEWQPKTFTMPNGKTYRPDLYLINDKLWVEIKGWMRKDAQEKWDWFSKEYPNSELWGCSELKLKGINVK